VRHLPVAEVLRLLRRGNRPGDAVGHDQEHRS
jgi:hypothetical protein